MEGRLSWVGDRSLRVVLGEGTGEEVGARVRSAWRALRAAEVPALRSVTPAWATLLLSFDPGTLDPEAAESAVWRTLAGVEASSSGTGRRVEVPVCYERDFALDVEEVARLRGLSTAAVVALHTAATYTVRFLGFSPGFPYLAGLPAALSVPRLDTPRVRVPAGSVAIASGHAGVYPRETPGGWRILGRTPLSLFEPARDPSSLLAVGDEVRFVRVDRSRFEDLLAAAHG